MKLFKLPKFLIFTFCIGYAVAGRGQPPTPPTCEFSVDADASSITVSWSASTAGTKTLHLKQGPGNAGAILDTYNVPSPLTAGSHTFTSLAPSTYWVNVINNANNTVQGSCVGNNIVVPADECVTPSCTIEVIPSNNVYTGGNPNIIYLGYGPQSATLQATASGGSGFSYSWAPGTNLSCTNCDSPVFTPTAEGNYTFTCTVTNSEGCSSTCEVSLCVIDIRVPGPGNKVYICHAPPGNPSNSQTLAISVNAVPSHLGLHGGDRLGQCNQSTACGSGSDLLAPSFGFQSKIHVDAPVHPLVYPNPFRSEINLLFPEEMTGDGEVGIYDLQGRMLSAYQFEVNHSGIKLNPLLDAGIYLIRIKAGGVSQTIKLVKKQY